MRTCTMELFKFNELEDDAKERALDACRNFNVDHDDWYENVYDDAKSLGAIIGIDIEKIWFSGFWSQGDGACFDGSYGYKAGSVAAIRKEAPQDAELHRIAKALQDAQRPAFYKLSARSKHRGHYYHEGCTDIDVFNDVSGDYATREQHDEIKEALRDFMRWIYRALEAEYTYQTSDEQVRESIEANEYEFTARGTFH